MTANPGSPVGDSTQQPTPISGMTTKVVKGSLWTLAGQVVPLGFSLFATPIVIRLLGTEDWGVLLVVLLIPGFLGFADFGMGMASTKFGSEAFSAGSREKEARIVRTAAFIAMLSSIPVAAPVFFFSGSVVSWFNVPERSFGEASVALKLAAITFVLNLLCLIFNTPQITRLRMDLNTFVNSGFRILGIIATPVVIYAGGGIVGAVAVLMTASALTLAGHILVSGRLLKELLGTSIERSAVRPMLRFGAALAGASVAAIILTNLEKAVLPKLASVTELAYYSVAFTLAGMLTLFSASMSQSLMPAFAQLRTSRDPTAYNALFTRAIRLNLLWLIPVVSILAVVAGPFFTIWAGPEFGVASVLPFNLLLLGLIFNIPAHVPFAVLMAAGRTDILAKIYWIELAFYAVLAWFLVKRFGAAGAAAAWSVRMMFDAVVLFLFAERHVELSIRGVRFMGFSLAALVMIVPFAMMTIIGQANLFIFGLIPVACGVYALIVWHSIVTADEAVWIKKKINSVLAFTGG